MLPRYFKITPEDERDLRMQYCDGFVEDSEPFTKTTGGILFAETQYIDRWYHHGVWIREVFPQGDVMREHDCCRARAVVFGQRVSLDDVEKCKALGIPPTMRRDRASFGGRVDILEWMWEYSARLGDDCPSYYRLDTLGSARKSALDGAAGGHVAVLEFLQHTVCSLESCRTDILETAVRSKHAEVVHWCLQTLGVAPEHFDLRCRHKMMPAIRSLAMETPSIRCGAAAQKRGS